MYLNLFADCSDPVSEVHAVCMSIVSMLSSAQEKVRPQDKLCREGRHSPVVIKEFGQERGQAVHLSICSSMRTAG